MALYSASQLLGKTFLLNKTVDVFKVIDIVNVGYQAQSVGTIAKDHTFIMDSYLLPTDGYTNIYGIHYAKRNDLYFTFFDLSNNYLAVKALNDGRFSLEALKDQGALTVKEEEDKKKYEDMGFFEKLMYDIFHGGAFKTVLVLAGVFVVGSLIIKSQKNKR